MNRWDIRGQKIKVEPLDNEERDKHGYVIKKGTNLAVLHASDGTEYVWNWRFPSDTFFRAAQF